MSVGSNKAALLSAKSSVGLSWEEEKKTAKVSGTLPRDSNTKLNLQDYQDTVLPEEEIKVKSNPFGLSKVRLKGTLFRILNNPGISLEPGLMANSSSHLQESRIL